MSEAVTVIGTTAGPETVGLAMMVDPEAEAQDGSPLKEYWMPEFVNVFGRLPLELAKQIMVLLPLLRGRKLLLRTSPERAAQMRKANRNDFIQINTTTVWWSNPFKLPDDPPFGLAQPEKRTFRGLF